MKIKLKDWAAKRYAGMPDHTLRRWARSGEIQPKPELVGREYWVEESAERIGVPRPNQGRIGDRL